MWDRRVTDLSFHTLIKSHPGVLDAFQSPGALGKTGGSHNIILNAPFCVLHIHRHAHTQPTTTLDMLFWRFYQRALVGKRAAISSLKHRTCFLLKLPNAKQQQQQQQQLGPGTRVQFLPCLPCCRMIYCRCAVGHRKLESTGVLLNCGRGRLLLKTEADYLDEKAADFRDVQYAECYHNTVKPRQLLSVINSGYCWPHFTATCDLI